MTQIKHYSLAAFQQTHYQSATHAILSKYGILPIHQGIWFAFNDKIFGLCYKFGNGNIGKETVNKTAYIFAKTFADMLQTEFDLSICNEILNLYQISPYSQVTHGTVTLRPISNGDANQLYDQNGIQGSPSAYVDESDQNDATFLHANTGISVAEESLFHCSTFSGSDNISNVRIWIRHKETYTTDIIRGKTYTVVRVSGATDYQVLLPPENIIANDYVDYVNSPATGLPWTKAELNATQFGVRCDSYNFHGSLKDAWSYEIWIEVSY
jgi:hypothetical protein